MCLDNKQTTAIIFNIQRFSVFDGPGVRTAVFFKGCNLRCRWCHNPESYEKRPQLAFDKQKCIGCGSCVENCPGGCLLPDPGRGLVYDRRNCRDCGSCTRGCYARALSRIGYEITAEELMEELLEELPYYRESGGGVTFSGGECMLQTEPLLELLKSCRKEGIHTAVDTAGNVPWSSLEEVLPWTDLFLYDIKAFDPKVHKACTGVTNERILENFRSLADRGAAVTVRIPYVPELNGTQLEGIASFLSGYPQIRAELLPYHSMGNSKYHALEETFFAGTAPDKKAVEQLKKKYHFY